MNLPKNHQTVMPYLMLERAAAFIDYTTIVFGAALLNQQLHDDGRMMHSEIQIGGCTIMFSESSNEWRKQTAHLFIYVEDADNTFKKAINEGGKVIMELNDQDYGRTCGVEDPFGNVWWITSIES